MGIPRENGQILFSKVVVNSTKDAGGSAEETEGGSRSVSVERDVEAVEKEQDTEEEVVVGRRRL